VDLQIVIEHHQRGLQGFREAVSEISSASAEVVYAGSLILVAFIFASLQVPELNPTVMVVHAVPSAGPMEEMQNPQSIQFSWLHLICGVSTVITDEWPRLKASRLRQMVLFLHGDEYWNDLPFTSSPLSLSNCSPRLLKFAQGASRAISKLKAFPQISSFAPVNASYCVRSPESLSSSTTSDGIFTEQIKAIDILESIYTRIISVLHCSVSEQDQPDDSDIQINFEESAVISWPVLLPSGFIALLETGKQSNVVYGHSLTIAAHFYLVNTLIDRWFLNGSLEGEILKINHLVRNMNDHHLVALMLWPIEVLRS